LSRISSEIIYCAAGTPYPNNPRLTAYKHARRDIWPMVDDPHGLDVAERGVGLG
jgi:microcystin degradation protein MlrC